MLFLEKAVAGEEGHFDSAAQHCKNAVERAQVRGGEDSQKIPGGLSPDSQKFIRKKRREREAGAGGGTADRSVAGLCEEGRGGGARESSACGGRTNGDLAKRLGLGV